MHEQALTSRTEIKPLERIENMVAQLEAANEQLRYFINRFHNPPSPIPSAGTGGPQLVPSSHGQHLERLHEGLDTLGKLVAEVSAIG